ncbi:EamA family transporter, partial [Lentibacter algarum]
GLGLLSGVLFACSAVAYRGATLEVQATDPLLRALVTMPCVTLFQAFALGGYLRWREAGEVSRVLGSWRTSVWMGLAGMGGSLCWFTAFAMMNAAYVFAVGQVEVIFSIIVSVWFFGEVITRREWVGMGLITASVLALVWLY